MIEIIISGNIVGGDAAEMTINMDMSRLPDIDTAVEYHVGRMIAASFAPFQSVDTITLSNHDTGHIVSWVVTEDHVDSHVAIKYLSFVIDEIMSFADTSRDLQAVDMIAMMKVNGKSNNEIIQAVVDMGYAPFFARTWVFALNGFQP